MEKLSQKIWQKIEKFAIEKHKNSDFNHDMKHIKRTVRLAEFLAKKEKADLNICKIAAYLHDVGQSKQIKGHEPIGAFLAQKFLENLGLNKKFIKKITHCIEAHAGEFKKKRTKEAKILFDADRLQILGPYGFCRMLTGGIYNKNMNLDEAFKFAKKTGNYKILLTNSAKKLVKGESDFMEKFYKLYEKWDKVKL